MASENNSLDLLIESTISAIGPSESAVAAAADGTVTMRDQFLELLTLALGNLYAKMPLPAQLFDRAMLRPVLDGMDDTDASKLTGRTEDWIRLENLVRGTEGQKSYVLNRPSMAVLSGAGPAATLGEAMARVMRAYSEQKATPDIRRAARALGTYFLTRIARN